jgi:thiosulfate/3-mercaptopyruvate sulfurtransferase
MSSRRLSWSFSFLLAALALVATAGCTGSQPAARAPVAMDSLVSAEWLAQHMDDPDLVVLDCTVKIEPTGEGGMRAVSGRAAYDADHIPGAGFADLMVDLADTSKPIGFAVPTPERFCAAMGALGVGDGSRVVLYDSNNSVWAARVWWMLRWIGFDNAALLDGGLKGWTEGGRPLSSDPVQRSEETLSPAVRPKLIADRDEVFASIEDDRVHLIDSLPAQSYRGEMTMYARPGHIPSAVNIPVLDSFDESGRFKSQQELAAFYPADRSERYITYCGGGIAASGSAFVMTRLGFTDVAVYTASLQEWTADPANPMEVAEEKP